MPTILMVWYPDLKIHISRGHYFWTACDKVITFSGFSFLDGYIHLKKFQQNPLGSGGKFFKIRVISHGMTLKRHIFARQHEYLLNHIVILHIHKICTRYCETYGRVERRDGRKSKFGIWYWTATTFALVLESWICKKFFIVLYLVFNGFDFLLLFFLMKTCTKCYICFGFRHHLEA